MPPLAKKRLRRKDLNHVGKAVAQLRKAQRLTQDALAARAQVAGWEVSTDIIRKIELGAREVTDIELKKLAKMLRVPALVLVDMI